MTELADGKQVSFELIPDPSELEEMRGGRSELIADEELGNSRVVVTQLAAERLPGSDDLGVAALDVTFHPDRGNRFVFAKVSLSILSPASTAFVDVQPRETIVESVEIAIDESGNMSLGVPKIIGGEASVGKKVSFVGQHRLLRALGAGLPTAIWEFEEVPTKKEGILHHVELAMTVPAGEPIICSLSIVAHLARPGLGGTYEKFRQMIFGPRSHELKIVIPEEAPRESSFWKAALGLFR